MEKKIWHLKRLKRDAVEHSTRFRTEEYIHKADIQIWVDGPQS